MDDSAVAILLNQIRDASSSPDHDIPGLLHEIVAEIWTADWQTRQKLALALGDRNDFASQSALELLAVNDPEWRVRETAIKAIAEAISGNLTGLLISIAMNDPHPAPAEQAVKSLGELALARIGRVPLLHERRVSVRVRGIPREFISPYGLSESAAEDLLPIIEQMAATHTDPTVRNTARALLSRL